MQRRDFVRTALLGTGAACSLALPSAYAAIGNAGKYPLRTELARLEEQGGTARWRSIERCASDACTAPQRVRISIEALAFPVGFGVLSIDAMFDTSAGVKPFRVASHQPQSLSPSSKPFSFEADSAGLAGFRAEHVDATSGSTRVCASPLLGASRPVLAVGRYLLVVANDAGVPDIESLSTPSADSDLIAMRNGVEMDAAWLSFSVRALTA
jgi:hypothetical protein